MSKYVSTSTSTGNRLEAVTRMRYIQKCRCREKMATTSAWVRVCKEVEDVSNQDSKNIECNGALNESRRRIWSVTIQKADLCDRNLDEHFQGLIRSPG
jgi:hypothetical protein